MCTRKEYDTTIIWEYFRKNTNEYQNRMFRRLAETFDGTGQADSDPHAQYITQQTRYFDTLPNMIPSATSGLSGFDKAIQSANTLGQGLQNHAVKYPNDIFRPDISPELAKLASACATSTVDELIAMKNSSLGVGCGWMYTPPNRGSPYPVLSKGMIGNKDGPLQGFDAPDYKKWFFDLQLAKKQALMDKCKALKGCTDVDQDIFQGSCGYCTDTNQGVPIDNVGKPLYPNDPRGNCTDIISSRSQCPPPPASGPQPVIDRTCEPVNGRLSSACMYRQVISAGCTDGGALAIALNGSTQPDDYISNLRNGDAVKLYNRTANPPLNLDMFRQGQATVNQVLQEVRQLSGNTNQASNSAIGAAARDLCLQRGAIKGYNTCENLPDGQAPPFDLGCLQELFLKMGGQPAGWVYPTIQNLKDYNNMGTLGAVKQYWNQLIADMKKSDSFADYNTQRNALGSILGISAEVGITRAPYTQGVEVFWFVLVPGQPQRVIGFLKRTIERDWVQLRAGPSGISQLGGISYGSMIQMTDVRVTTDTSAKFNVVVDDGFWLAVNQPADIDKTAMGQTTADQPGLFENLGLQGPTPYQSNASTIFRASKPNIAKMYFEDAGGGWNALQLTIQPAFRPTMYSLTCEPHAPFLTYEVGPKSGTWEELRNPGMFSQFMGVQNPEYHVRTDEKTAVPGKKAFMRMNGSSSSINLPNIAFQSWRTMSFAVRFQSMPVKETLCHIFPASNCSWSFAIVATPINGSTATITLEVNYLQGGRVITKQIPTVHRLVVGTWYMFYVINKKTSFDVYCNYIDGFLSSNESAAMNSVTLDGNTPLWNVNATWNPAPGQNAQPCNILFGGGIFQGGWGGVYGTSSFTYDMAWIHFFDREVSNADVVRECKCDWIYTQFPDTFDNYKTLSA